MFDKLKSNNNYLAKTLAHEKQNNQSLFSQNLALIAEVQNLKLACNKRNVSIIYINKQKLNKKTILWNENLYILYVSEFNFKYSK